MKEDRDEAHPLIEDEWREVKIIRDELEMNEEG